MRSKVIAILRKVIPDIEKIEVVFPENDTHGHYSTSAAFMLSKKWKVSPYETACKVKEKIAEADKDKLFRKIEAVTPGFINFWLSDEALQNELKEILKKKSNYGRTILPKKKDARKVQLEYISANPTGPLTLANGRGGFLGDALAHVLEFAGYKVEREYYVNDTGNQIISLGKSCLVALGYNLGQLADEAKLYKGDYIKKWAVKHATFIKKNQEKPLLIGQRAAKDFLATTKLVLKRKAGIAFDRYTSEERDIHKKKLPDEALALFMKRGLVYEKDGAIWLKTTEFDDDKDRVLITSDGYPTYFLADAGHFLEAVKRGFHEKILILGPDHYGYVARIKAAAQLVGLAKPDILVTQTIRVVKDGKEFKMSKREGEFLTFEEVIDEVGKDAARFFFLMHTPGTHMDFDLKLAKERSMKNPVYYVQYAYVRCFNILKRARNLKLKIKNLKFNLLKSEADIKLLLHLVRFQEIMEDTANDYAVHRLTRYAVELAHIFHNFYEKERVVGEKDRSLATARLELVRATEIVLGNTLDLLGVSKPKRM